MPLVSWPAIDTDCAVIAPAVLLALHLVVAFLVQCLRVLDVIEQCFVALVILDVIADGGEWIVLVGAGAEKAAHAAGVVVQLEALKP